MSRKTKYLSIRVRPDEREALILASKDWESFSSWARSVLNPLAGKGCVDIDFIKTCDQNRSGKRARKNGGEWLGISCLEDELAAYKEAAVVWESLSAGSWARDTLLKAANEQIEAVEKGLAGGSKRRISRKYERAEKQLEIVRQDRRFLLKKMSTT